MRFRIWFLLAGSWAGLWADERGALEGKVVDGGGNPVDHAMVLVYQAGPKQGYSAFCPTCYADCGKRTLTDAQGGFHFQALSSDLWFNLLVLREGSVPTLVKKVDPV